MKSLDKHYLSVQFQIKVRSKDATEFQSFFESIMEKAFFPDFQTIRPYQGDGGNDGYRKEAGIYYQCYSPRVPGVKDAEAATKWVDDFRTLKEKWNEISEIKEHNFVFNDKYGGSIQELEKTQSDLERDNPNVKFKLFLPKRLEEIFFQLSEDQMMSLGFNVDRRQALKQIDAYLESIKTELDRENAKSAQKILEIIKEIISNLDDENVSLEYEILECRCLQKLEKVGDAKAKYENLSRRFPNDPRPILYLAEIYLNSEDFDKNHELLEKAERIDANNWLLRLEKFLRKIRLTKTIDIKDLEEKTFGEYLSG